MITKETIARFFSNKSTPQEAAEVHAFLEENPEVLQAMEAEWSTFEPSEQLSEEQTDKLWQTIQRQIRAARIITPQIRRLVAAAAVILFALIGWYFWERESTRPPSLVQASQNSLKTSFNPTNEVMTLWLSDSSLVQLSPGSQVIYPDPFDSQKRQVTLKGEAIFTVRKDPSRPFTVTSDSLMTTALGTKFTIKCHENQNIIQVILQEGKVSVTPFSHAFKAAPPVYILAPGDVLSYDRKTSEISLNTLKTQKSLTGNNMANGIAKKGGAMNSDNWYMFNNQPIEEVFTQFEVLYNVKITYNPGELKGMSFIGKIDKSDSLESILQSFALLNNLLLTKEGNSYSLKKR